MTWLFVRFYLCVLLVLFSAWYIYARALKGRAEADTQRVILAAHGGGARLVAGILDAALPSGRDAALQRVRQHFGYPVEVLAGSALPDPAAADLRRGLDVACLRLPEGHAVVASLAGGADAVRLGPFPDYDLREIEAAIGGWMQLTADTLAAAPRERQRTALQDLQRRFEIPLAVVNRNELPAWPLGRLAAGERVVFYPHGPPAEDRWLAATPLADGGDVLRFGPFPSFERIEQKAATTTLALVLLPAALAIALLLRPVARQLNHIEHAARKIAGGDLSARVEQRRVRSARRLARAFNQMADRTETLVRTQRELLQAVSHELRTPLSRIRFAIDLIATAGDDAERARRLAALESAAEDLDKLVGELLTYVRMETAQPEVQREPLALREVLAELLAQHAALYPAIVFELDDGVGDELVVFAERIGLQRALGNLLNNAGRFARRRVTISAAATSDAIIEINVDDDGDGIPESERERVFEPFVRLPQEAAERGVGLGLALVHRIVSQHGGRVAALASPAGGCRIRTLWPARA